MTAGSETWKESDGRAVSLTLTYAVTAGDVCYINGFMGIAMATGIAGDIVAFDIFPDERWLEVPAALNVAIGDEIWIDVPNMGSNHKVPSAAFLKATATNARRFGRCVETESSDNIVRIIRYHGAY
jgi:hypothetical protein